MQEAHPGVFLPGEGDMIGVQLFLTSFVLLRVCGRVFLCVPVPCALVVLTRPFVLGSVRGIGKADAFPGLCSCVCASSFQSGVASRLMPLFGRCVVQKVQPSAVSKGGIYIPSSASQQTGCHIAKVVAVAPPKPSANAAVSEDWSKLQVGQTVMVPEYGGMKLQLEEEELFVFRGEDILAVVKDQ